MVKRTVCLLALLLLAASSWLPAEAAYRFRVTRMKAWVQAENDGSIRISYDISFYAGKGSVDLEDVLPRIDLVVTGPHASAAFPEEMSPFVVLTPWTRPSRTSKPVTSTPWWISIPRRPACLA